MKGIILAGGSGTRLYPITISNSKQLLPVYDKPMIYYPLSVLMLAGIKEILIISSPNDLPRFEKLLGNGSNIGIKLKYAEQAKPEGIAQAFIIGKNFIGNDSVTLILGDNIFYGEGLNNLLLNGIRNAEKNGKASLLAYYVNDPTRYGVCEFNEAGDIISLEEKPKVPKSNYAAVGLYFYPNNVIKYIDKIKKSARGELEITSLNEYYMSKKKLKVEIMGRGYAWFDTGTCDSLLDASLFMKAIQKRQNLIVASIEFIAYYLGYIDLTQLHKLALKYNNSYGEFLLKIKN
tara:strand:- start:281 stop:1150 length:870 start_codon:yes stop_codon:yes gene_type:complete